MRYIVFDLETQNLFQEVGSNDPSDLDISVASLYDSETNKYYPGDLTTIKSIDLLDDIKIALGRRLRLDSVAQATIGAKKSADGLQAVRWWREGKIKEVMKYCEQDVKVTKQVFEYARKHGHVKFKDGARNREIVLNTAHWEELDGEASLTHSLF